MAVDNLYFNLFACEASERYNQPLEARVVGFLESRPRTESLDGPSFSKINAAQSKADYLLGGRKIVAELKTINAMPHDAIEERLRERFAQSCPSSEHLAQQAS